MKEELEGARTQIGIVHSSLTAAKYLNMRILSTTNDDVLNGHRRTKGNTGDVRQGTTRKVQCWRSELSYEVQLFKSSPS